MKKTFLESCLSDYLEKLSSLFCVFEYMQLNESYSIQDYETQIERLSSSYMKLTRETNNLINTKYELENDDSKGLNKRDLKELVESLDGLLFNILHYFRKMSRLVMITLNDKNPNIDKKELTKVLEKTKGYNTAMGLIYNIFYRIKRIVTGNKKIFFTHCFKHTEQIQPEDLTLKTYIGYQKKYKYLDTHIKIEPRLRSIG